EREARRFLGNSPTGHAWKIPCAEGGPKHYSRSRSVSTRPCFPVHRIVTSCAKPSRAGAARGVLFPGAMKRLLITELILTATITACSGTANDKQNMSPPGNSSDDTLAPPAAGQGYQYLMTSTLNPGQEIERCKFIVTPSEGYYI